jgi:hypothetical protein
VSGSHQRADVEVPLCAGCKRMRANVHASTMRTIQIAGALVLFLAAPLAMLATGASATVPEGAVALQLEGCSYLEILVKVPAQLVDPLVPADFNLIVGADGMETLALSGASCDRGVSGAWFGPGSFTSLLARVQQPADPALAGVPSGVGIWFYRLEHYVQAGDLYRQVSDAAGVDVVPVTALAVDSEDLLSTMTVQSSDLDLRVLAPATPDGLGLGGGEARWREFHEVPAGYAVLEATLAADLDGGLAAGVVTASEGSVLHALGGPVNPGPLSYGRDFAIRDAWMGVLPKP